MKVTATKAFTEWTGTEMKVFNPGDEGELDTGAAIARRDGGFVEKFDVADDSDGFPVLDDQQLIDAGRTQSVQINPPNLPKGAGKAGKAARGAEIPVLDGQSHDELVAIAKDCGATFADDATDDDIIHAIEASRNLPPA